MDAGCALAFCMQNLADDNSLIPTARGAGIAVCQSSRGSLDEFVRAGSQRGFEKRIFLLVRDALHRHGHAANPGAERFADGFIFWLVISSAQGARLCSQEIEGPVMVCTRVFAV